MSTNVNKANQNNPNHSSYWKSRGYSKRPHNWRDLIDSDEYDSDDNSVLSWISKTSTPGATSQEYMILPYNKATTSMSKKSVEDCAKEGAAIGAGLFVLGKMIFDSFNENEESEKNQRQRSRKY